MEGIVLAIESGASRGLRTLGLFVDFQKKTQIAELQLGRALTETEEKQIRYNAVMREGTKIQGAHAAASQTVEGQLGAAFVAPACACFGNSGRDILRGPGFANIDAGLSRECHLGERSRVQFRAEGFNLLNHPNLGLPASAIGDARSVGNWVSNQQRTPSPIGDEILLVTTASFLSVLRADSSHPSTAETFPSSGSPHRW